MYNTAYRWATVTLVGCMVFILTPLISLSHGVDQNLDHLSSETAQIRAVEDQIVGDVTHERMETLMQKMVQGTLTEMETIQIAELIEEHQGVSGMMLSRMMRANDERHHVSTMWGMGLWGPFGIVLVIAVAVLMIFYKHTVTRFKK